MNNLPSTFVFAEPLFLIPFGSSTGRPGGDVPARVNIFGGTSFPHAPKIGLASRKLGGKARAESLHFFSTEPLFLIRFGLRSAARKLVACRIEIVTMDGGIYPARHFSHAPCGAKAPRRLKPALLPPE